MTPDQIAAAAAALRAGRIVGIPTDTVYGLACDPTRPGATATLFAAKGRPEHLQLRSSWPTWTTPMRSPGRRA